MKEEYIIMRNSGQYRIEWLYSYYKSKGGKDIDIQTFHQLFSMGPLQQLLDKIDKEYELTSLHDVNGKLIRVWQ